ncbi:MAG: ABC transporter permease [Eubacteriales bacterium]|nr:ABC transporter permease [Eubacteriales bacterium]
MKSKIDQSVIRKLVSLSMVVIMVAVFSATAQSFLTSRNIFSVLREVSVIGLLSIGVTFVIIGGGIDISTGAIMAVSAMICSRLVNMTLMPIWLIVCIAVGAGILCGLINGLLVTKLKMSELITTFATMFIYRGIVYMLAFRDEDGRLITKAITDKGFLTIAGKWGNFYPMTLVWIAAVVIGYLLLKKTKLGTYIYAIGTDRKAALFSGIKVDRIKIATFIISGICAATAGVLLVAWQASVALSSGSGMEFQAIAAAVVGGIALAGGRGDTIGTAIGSIFMVMLINGIYKYGLPTEIQTITYGVVIVIMSVFDSIYFRALNKRNQVTKRAVGRKGEAS